MSNIQYRIATIRDIDNIRFLFRETINTVNVAHYSPFEIEAWSKGSEIIENWVKRIDNQYFIIAEDGVILVGMATITDSGYLDVMYVHQNYQGQGIASTLLSRMEAKAIANGLDEITSDVSITAKPFFLKKGFQIIRPQLVLCRGVVLRNYNVSKSI